MNRPDFALFAELSFSDKDLLFLFENFPVPGVDPVEAVRRVHEHPSTLESVLDSRYLKDAVLARDGRWLDISPGLFFNVLLRQALPRRRDALDREVVHYLANLLARFAHGDRLYRLQGDDPKQFQYLVDLIEEGAGSPPERRFLVDAHIGNFALYLSGMCEPWIQHRETYRRRPVSLEYYTAMGANHYAQAADSWQATRYGLHDIFERLSQGFEYFRKGMRTVAEQVFPSIDRDRVSVGT